MGARATQVRDEFAHREPERSDHRRRWESSPTVKVGRPDMSPEEIRSDIARTREDMAETIDEIQSRLSADNLTNQAKEIVRDATIGRVEEMSYRANRKMRGVTANIVETVRDNPVPAALVGIGLGWLMIKGQDRPSYNYPYYRDEYGQEHYRPQFSQRYERHMTDEMRSRSGGRMEEVKQRAEEAVDDVREGARELGEQAREMGRQAKDRVEDFTHQAREQVDDLRYQARERAEEWGDEIQDRARYASDRAQRTYYSNPLGVAAAAVALGLVVGLAIPESEAEHRWLGETRDNLVERAKEATQETVDRVQRVAAEAGRAASEEAEEQFAGVAERTGAQNRTDL